MRNERTSLVGRLYPACKRIGYACVFSLPFAAVWWALTGGDTASWIIGAPAVAIATLASLSLATPAWWRFQPLGAMRFLLFFVSRSIYSGVDVAWRALDPRAPLAPDFIEYPLHLPDGPPLVVFASTANLLPGTLSVEITGSTITIHALNAGDPVLRELRELESRVAALFGLEATG